MLTMIRKALWGDISQDEMRQFSFLALAFFCIIGAYWMLRLIKNATFMHLVGPQNLPYAKMVSVVSLFCIVLFYNKLVDLLEKTKLIYIITTTYGLLFVLAAFLLNQVLGGAPVFWAQALGWVLYVAIESLGSLVVSLFWAYAASSVDGASAKRGYPFVIFCGQIGSVLGASLVTTMSRRLGVPLLTCIPAFALLMVPFVIGRYVTLHGKGKEQEPAAAAKKTTSVLEGLRLIFTQPYLMGVLVVSTAYEIIMVLLELQMNTAAYAAYSTLEEVTSFLGIYGVSTNLISLLFALLGTSFVIRRFGLTACLVAYPLGIACLVLYAWMFPGIWSFLIAVVALKGLSYALNNPCKEMLYIPTSRDVKFKAKSWIDVQGGRSAKATGATIAACFKSSMAALLSYGSIISLGIIALWIPIALFVGRRNEQLVKRSEIIE